MLHTSPGASGGGRIRVLPDALVDQIAAGEVVERPASVVKELVENSLDAGARTIGVDVREGGLALIAVQDDGVGMTPEELPIALERHATSKLRSVDDLARIASFGFRGEALPAIASVSRFRIVSRTRGAAAGHEILIEAGRRIHSRTAGGPEGTRIEVADLFAAVPARRKFLKRPTTEWSHISDWLARLAMARPEIHVEIRRDDRAPTIWPACDDRRDRLALLLPEEDGASLIDFDHPGPDLRLHGFVSTPEHSRATGQGVHLFVNGRPVRDRLLAHAVGEPYRDLLPRGRFPVAVVFVEIAPDQVDVNVHPAKWEVRFRDPQAVHRALRHAVRDAIGSRRWLALTPASRRPDGSLQPGGTGSTSGREPVLGEPASDFSLRVRESASHWGEVSQTSLDETPSDWLLTSGAAALTAPHTALDTRDRSSGSVDAATNAEGADRRPVAAFGALNLLGQLQASYLLAEGERGLVVIDQHAAHERILYEGLRRRWLAGGVARQALLEPLVVAVSAAAVAAVESARDLVSRLGFELDPFASEALLLRAVPAELADRDPRELVRELADALVESEGLRDAAEESDVRWLPELDRMFATMACHAARRFGDRLPPAEQRALLRGLDTIPWAPTCPHGRPVAVLVDLAELEARFRRR